MSGWKEGSVWLGVRKDHGGLGVGGGEGESVRREEGRALGMFLPTGFSSAPKKVFLSPDASDSLCKSGKMLLAVGFKESSDGCGKPERSGSD